MFVGADAEFSDDVGHGTPLAGLGLSPGGGGTGRALTSKWFPNCDDRGSSGQTVTVRGAPSRCEHPCFYPHTVASGPRGPRPRHGAPRPRAETGPWVGPARRMSRSCAPRPASTDGPPRTRRSRGSHTRSLLANLAASRAGGERLLCGACTKGNRGHGARESVVRAISARSRCREFGDLRPSRFSRVSGVVDIEDRSATGGSGRLAPASVTRRSGCR